MLFLLEMSFLHILSLGELFLKKLNQKEKKQKQKQKPGWKSIS